MMPKQVAIRKHDKTPRALQSVRRGGTEAEVTQVTRISGENIGTGSITGIRNRTHVEDHHLRHLKAGVAETGRTDGRGNIQATGGGSRARDLPTSGTVSAGGSRTITGIGDARGQGAHPGPERGTQIDMSQAEGTSEDATGVIDVTDLQTITTDPGRAVARSGGRRKARGDLNTTREKTLVGTKKDVATEEKVEVARALIRGAVDKKTRRVQRSQERTQSRTRRTKVKSPRSAETKERQWPARQAVSTFPLSS